MSESAADAARIPSFRTGTAIRARFTVDSKFLELLTRLRPEREYRERSP